MLATTKKQKNNLPPLEPDVGQKIAKNWFDAAVKRNVSYPPPRQKGEKKEMPEKHTDKKKDQKEGE